MCILRSNQHQIYMLQIKKKSLSIIDDKRYAVDRYNMLPFDHRLTFIDL